MRKLLRTLVCLLVLVAGASASAAPFMWENATVYFLLTDRFAHDGPVQDQPYGRRNDAAPLRGFMGGNLAGITKAIRDGYFRRLGVDAIWFSPVVEQIHGAVDEGTGKTYGFHGYWARDWTHLDASFGTEDDLHTLIDTAHANGIRVLFDVVMNHTGPETQKDPVWPKEWVRLDPQCTYKDVATTVSCVLVKGLPDVRTERLDDVLLPPELIAKWKEEGRYEREIAELDAFFKRTGYPRSPRYYLIKWHTDWVRKFGIDGFRADTAKHVEPEVWQALKQEASLALGEWQQKHPGRLPETLPFFMTAEIYNYVLAHGREFDMGGGAPGSKIDFYAHGFDSIINFGFKGDASGDYETLFSRYANALHGPLRGVSVLNYISSHDDMQPFDLKREKPFEAGTKLLLSPGAAQIYYGDETARDLSNNLGRGDAALRSQMNWHDIMGNAEKRGGKQHYRVVDVLMHWRKLGMFRHRHPAIGAGEHRMLSKTPYAFVRKLDTSGFRDRVVVALDLPRDRASEIAVGEVFADGTLLHDAYSGKQARVEHGKVVFETGAPVLLLEMAAE